MVGGASLEKAGLVRGVSEWRRLQATSTRGNERKKEAPAML